MKKLIATLLAAGVVVGVATASGCQDESKLGTDLVPFNKDIIAKNLVVACYERNKDNQLVKTLHRADVYLIHGYQLGGPTYFDFKCSKDDETNESYSIYYDGLPSKNAYDEVCEECFPQMRNQFFTQKIHKNFNKQTKISKKSTKLKK